MKDFVTNIVLSLQAAANLETGGGHVGDGAAVVVVAHLLAVLLVAGAVADAHVRGRRRRRPRQPPAESHAAATAGKEGRNQRLEWYIAEWGQKSKDV